ncbi:hypothetical protein [Vibrio vulnificus]|uniref:hypothetical protein n=1 Tax=Vibrio vulnificus TaxID=672 RepID=UPI003241E3FB
MKKGLIRLLEQCKVNNWTIHSEYKNTKVPLLIRCEHGHHFKMSQDNVCNQKRNCPLCNKANNNGSGAYSYYDSATFYTVRWVHPVSKKSFLKFGITNETDYLKRVVVQSSKTEYLPEKALLLRFFIDGAVPPAIERVIKNELDCGVVTREEFGDGYSETVADTQENIDFIKQMVWGV